MTLSASAMTPTTSMPKPMASAFSAGVSSLFTIATVARVFATCNKILRGGIVARQLSREG